ncbi:MAG: hypothetical protein WCA77_09340 [Thermoplasmata archaeon]
MSSTSSESANRASNVSRRMIRTLTDGKRFESYVEQQTTEMRVCGLCDRVFYRRKPMKKIGARWVCIDCVRSLKEAIESLDRWEELTRLNDEIEKNVDEAFRR